MPGQIRGSGLGVGTIRGGGASPVSVGGAVKKRKERKINCSNSKRRINKLLEGPY